MPIPQNDGLDVFFARAQVHFDTRTRQTSPNSHNNMTFHFTPWMWLFCLFCSWKRICCLSREPCKATARIENHKTLLPLIIEQCPLTTGFVAWQCPSSTGDAGLVTPYLRSLISGCLNTIQTHRKHLQRTRKKKMAKSSVPWNLSITTT